MHSTSSNPEPRKSKSDKWIPCPMNAWGPYVIRVWKCVDCGALFREDERLTTLRIRGEYL